MPLNVFATLVFVWAITSLQTTEAKGSPAPATLTPSVQKVQHPSKVIQNSKGSTVVATDNLNAGTAVGRFEGPLYSFKQIPEKEIPYALRVGTDKWMIPATEMRYLHHSCQPNCKITSSLDVITTREVLAEEELTYCCNLISLEEYMAAPNDFFWDERWTFPCECKAKDCQGVIDHYMVKGYDKMEMRPGTKIALHTFKGKGRGVIAIERIEKGEVIERAPVIPGAVEEGKLTTLYNYAFVWRKEYYAIALGYGSLYNHSYKPNAVYRHSEDDLLINFIALKTIEKGEEITVNYNGDPENHAEVWFNVAEN